MSSACATQRKSSDQTTISNSISSSGDGSSFEKAIIIKEHSESAGINAEYAWISQNYPGYKSQGQALTYYKKVAYDIINIITLNGEKKSIYFNISNFFGKF